MIKEINIYLSSEDSYLVRVAQMIAEDQGITVSKVFVKAVKYYLANFPELDKDEQIQSIST